MIVQAELGQACLMCPIPLSQAHLWGLLGDYNPTTCSPGYLSGLDLLHQQQPEDEAQISTLHRQLE